MTKDINDVFANNLIKIRKERNLTQQEMSELLGISRGYLACLEVRKKHSVSLNTLQKLSNKLGVSIPDLLKE